MKQGENARRNSDIIQRRMDGEKLQELADEYGISRERVRQICARKGVVGRYWQGESKSARNQRETYDDKDARCIRKWGVTYREWRSIRAMHPDYHHTPLGQYCAQRSGAKRRGIEWHLTFADWWRIWTDSGKYDQRGHGADGYCMTRCRDDGPYATWNVRIRTNAENLEEWNNLSIHERGRRWVGGLVKRNCFESPLDYVARHG